MKRPEVITKEYLDRNPNLVFVFGDNTDRVGMGGAAVLRYHPQSLGFVTKIHPDNEETSFYTPSNYLDKYLIEIQKLRDEITNNPDKIFLITKLGAGLANAYGIWDKIIEPTIKILLSDFQNVEFLW